MLFRSGNAHDKESKVSKAREDNKQRMFYVIEQIHTLPNINYLAKVRNTDEIIESKHTNEEAGHGVETKESVPSH